MRRLTPRDYRRMPWRSGGGTTTEILVEPAGIDPVKDRFLYRISIADVASDGPFSRFAGYDRHIMLLSGAGMTLECGAHGLIDLTAPFEPRSFSGDWDVRGSLVRGAVRDFNLIVDRARASGSLAARLISAPGQTERMVTRRMSGLRGSAPERAKGGKLAREMAGVHRGGLARKMARAERIDALLPLAVEVRGIAHPGVHIRIGDARLQLESPMRNVRFTLDLELRTIRTE